MTSLRAAAAAMIVAMTVILTGCDDPRRDAGEIPPLVVEGWIEDGDHPYVIVTRVVDLSCDVDSFNDYVEKWCRVSVDDGSGPKLLSARHDTRYMPPWVFTSSRITGRPGATYTLKVETENATVTAVTTIPLLTRIDSVSISRSADIDSLFHIRAYPAVRSGETGYYKFFTRVRNAEPRYYSSFRGTFRGDTYDPEKGVEVHRGIHQTFEDRFTPYFRQGDTVLIKLCTMEREGFDFWEAYENAVSLGSNALFPVLKGCPSNLSDGAKGYWLGYGTSFRTVIIR